MNRTISFIEEFEKVVLTQGNAPAISLNGEVAYSYEELWNTAQSCAASLQQAGIGPEDVVAIGIPRSPEFIVAMIGTWIAGAAYTPLDPALPIERLKHIYSDSEACCLLTQPEQIDFWNEVSSELFSTDQLFFHVNPVVETPVRKPDHLAYIIYTSGTTGVPKGVEVEQRGVLNLLHWQIEAFQLNSQSRCLMIYSTSFDASISDIGTSLLAGSHLFLETGSLQSSVLEIIRKREITYVDLPPAWLALLDPQDAPESLKTITIGGECCPLETVRQWGQQCRIVNVYGPTEATVCTSLIQCDPKCWEQPILGQPLAEIVYLVVNEYLEPVSEGETGELLIGGISLARGYRNQPDLTAERFPYLKGKRFYRTGDRVLYTPSNEYVYCGRFGRQIQHKGYRIELEEIEQTLLSFPTIIRTAVLYRKRTPQTSRKSIIAFIALHEHVSDQTEFIQELTSSLKGKLPHWMQPTHIELVMSLPETNSGKIDYSLLSNQELSVDVSAEPGESETERILLESCQTILGIEQLGRSDDLISLGVDSLTMLEISVSCQAKGYPVPPDLIATHRTVQNICQANRSASGKNHKLSSQFLRNDVQPELRKLRQQHNSIEPMPRRQQNPKVLITGVTGFLGSHVLQQCLENSSDTFFCLVRAKNQHDAERRFQEILRDQRVALNSGDSARINIMPGDLSFPLMGLPEEQWQELTQSIDKVIHIAAEVNLLKSYVELRKANISGTYEVGKFVLTGKFKELHYASTLSVFVGSDSPEGIFYEKDDLSQTKYLYGGYVQSKWAAEYLLRSVFQNTNQLTIYRFGLLTGNRTTGKYPEHDLLTLSIKGLQELGCVPRNVPDSIQVDITPVDYAAVAMAYMVQYHENDRTIPNQTYHLANPQSLSANDLFLFLHEYVPELIALDKESFLQQIENTQSPTVSAACMSLYRWLAPEHQKDSFRPYDLFQSTGATFDMTETLNCLSSTKISCPLPNRELINDYMVQILKNTAIAP